MILKDILKGKPLGTKSAKDVKKALKQKNELVNSLAPTSEDKGPRGPVVLTVGTAKVTRDADEQRHQRGHQSTGNNEQTLARTAQSTPARRHEARFNNASTGQMNVSEQQYQDGSQSAGNNEQINTRTAPSTFTRRRGTNLNNTNARQVTANTNDSEKFECGYCGVSFGSKKILQMHWDTVQTCGNRRNEKEKNQANTIKNLLEGEKLRSNKQRATPAASNQVRSQSSPLRPNWLPRMSVPLTPIKMPESIPNTEGLPTSETGCELVRIYKGA